MSASAQTPVHGHVWAPGVVGSTNTDQVGAAAINSIAFSGGNCANAYIGGNFRPVNGTTTEGTSPKSAPRRGTW